MAGNSLATIDGTTVGLGHLLYLLKLREDFDDLVEALEDLLVVRLARGMGIEVSVEEIQSMADRFRQERDLDLAVDMYEWLKRNQLTVDDLEIRMEIECYRAKLKRAVTDQEIQGYFSDRRSSFDRARIRKIVVSSEDGAREVSESATKSGADFSALARRYSIDEESRHAGGYMGWIPRDALAPSVSARVFKAKAGEIVAPIRVGSSYFVILVEEIRPAELDATTEEVIREILFSEWFDRQARKPKFDVGPMQEATEGQEGRLATRKWLDENA